jgi:hypothetical protein
MATARGMPRHNNCPLEISSLAELWVSVRRSVASRHLLMFNSFAWAPNYPTEHRVHMLKQLNASLHIIPQVEMQLESRLQAPAATDCLVIKSAFMKSEMLGWASNMIRLLSAFSSVFDRDFIHLTHRVVQEDGARMCHTEETLQWLQKCSRDHTNMLVSTCYPQVPTVCGLVRCYFPALPTTPRSNSCLRILPSTAMAPRGSSRPQLQRNSGFTRHSPGIGRH